MSRTRAAGPQAELVERLRDLLAAAPTTREISMFGGRAILVHDRIVVSAWRSGDLLVRVAAERTDELLTLPGAAPAEMGSGRHMGAGWITVAAEAIVTDGSLAAWLAVALERGHTRTCAQQALVGSRHEAEPARRRPRGPTAAS